MNNKAVNNNFSYYKCNLLFLKSQLIIQNELYIIDKFIWILLDELLYRNFPKIMLYCHVLYIYAVFIRHDKSDFSVVMSGTKARNNEKTGLKLNKYNRFRCIVIDIFT